MNHRWIKWLSLIAGCTVLGCSAENNDLLKPRVSQSKVLDVAEPGVPITTIIEEFGEPHRRQPNGKGGETILYKTFIDWDKFIAHHLVWIETDETGRIVKVDTMVDPD